MSDLAEPTNLEGGLARIREVGTGDGINVDLAQREDVARFFEAADAWLGGLDIAVINAAIPAEALAETRRDDLDYQIAVDFTSYLTTTKAALDRMQAGSDIVPPASAGTGDRERHGWVVWSL